MCPSIHILLRPDLETRSSRIVAHGEAYPAPSRSSHRPDTSEIYERAREDVTIDRAEGMR